jgi:hypothetical protein
MAGAERFELPTIGFGDRCSTNWNYAPAMTTNYREVSPKVKRKITLLVQLLFK